MFLLGEINNAEFKRRKGSKNKIKKVHKLSDYEKYKNTREVRRNIHTSAEALNTARGVSRETRSWLRLAQTFGII